LLKNELSLLFSGSVGAQKSTLDQSIYIEVPVTNSGECLIRHTVCYSSCNNSRSCL